jgi:hypothetical protein
VYGTVRVPPCPRGGAGRIYALAKPYLNFDRHHPPPGLAFGEPKDRLRRMTQYTLTTEALTTAASTGCSAFAEHDNFEVTRDVLRGTRSCGESKGVNQCHGLNTMT